MINRVTEMRFLLLALLVNCLAFLLLSNSFLERGSCATTGLGGTIDLAPYMLGTFPSALIPAGYVALFLLFHAFLRQRLACADPYLLPVAAFICGVGLVVATRLSPDLAILRNTRLAAFPSPKNVQNVELLASLGCKQFAATAVAILAALFTLAAFDSRWFSSKKYLWGLICISLSLITLAFGRKLNGTRAWVGPFQFIELTKLLIILLIAGFVHEREKVIAAAKKMPTGEWLSASGPLIIIFIGVMIPIQFQRDIGPSIVIGTIFLLIFSLERARIWITCAIMAVGVAFLSVAYRIGYPPIVHDRFMKYFETFGRDLSGAKALWAISSGGFLGSGFGIGYGQAYQIPGVQSDYVPSVICEEFGLLMAIAMLLAYGVFTVRCLKIAARARTVFQQITVLGIAALFAVQTAIVWGGNLSAIPFTGLSLPLGGSYGGNSMVVSYVCLAIVMKISGDCYDPEAL